MGDRAAAADRRRALGRGQVSEYLAALYRMLKGYRIVALRYRTKLGEIDIIAKRNLAIFVEVKARRR
jgi:putative endonuclease